MAYTVDLSLGGVSVTVSTFPLILATLSSLLFLRTFLPISRPAPPRPTYSLHPLCPSIISGLHAAYLLGSDELPFLQRLRRMYPEGVVYIPFPLRHHLVLSNELVSKVYSGTYARQLSFIPVRLRMSERCFGTTSEALYDDRTTRQIFPVHTKALTSRANLEPAILRFKDEIENLVNEQAKSLSSAASSGQKIDLVKWAFETMFAASRAALFGSQCPVPLESFLKYFRDFDDGFPLLASGLIPLWLARLLPVTGKAIAAREYLNPRFGRWATETRCEGLEAGDVVHDMAEEMSRIRVPGKEDETVWSESDVGSAILGDFWALLANNPFAACWVIIYLIQLDGPTSAAVLAEIDKIDLSTDPRDTSWATDASVLPLLTSMVYETLRLHTSAFSMRRSIVDTPFSLGEGRTIVLPEEDVMCVTRATHIDETIWGETCHSWDGRRFYDDPEAAEVTNNRAKLVNCRPFGGGVSMCEGRQLALAEMKIFIVYALKTFSFTLGADAAQVCPSRLSCLNSAEDVILAPAAREGRPGLGVIQVQGSMPVTISLRKPVQ